MDYRSKTNQIDGTYLTISQSCSSTRIVQGALFAM
jgi:hypothetical protein